MVISDSVLQHAILITLLCPGTWHALQILANHQKWMRMTSDAHTSLELGPSKKKQRIILWLLKGFEIRASAGLRKELNFLPCRIRLPPHRTHLPRRQLHPGTAGIQRPGHSYCSLPR